ncbi:phosphotransferase-like protein [Legionella brunensis]|uniref:Cytidylate kinase n=1 Tax=Legionella brunensis TaxID=29422 RepID=A0A0W0S2V1_9GAMM|nr:AAA family ATPase [Legionella brunensis]KTC77843.1 cytidylate kinase [Legionella brunensis]
MIIIISGTSSSGKSTICQELQNKLGDGWINFSTDGYLGMLGNKFFDLHPNNEEVCIPNDICYAKKYSDGTYEIVPGKWCSKLYETIPNILRLIATQGFNIIVDSFITTTNEFSHYKALLEKYDPFFVYLYASEAVIAQREEARGDRLKGSALHWLKQFDYQDQCDLIINTEAINTHEVCASILEKLNL